ncbi:hypothetical protein LINPERHAP1_LOCUS4875 [Linum perenne]
MHPNPLFVEEVLAKERPKVFEEYGPWMLAKSQSKKNSKTSSKLAARTPLPTVEHSVSVSNNSEKPQGSRFTILAEEVPSSKPPSFVPPVGRVDPTSSVAAPQLGTQKKQKAKKGVGPPPEVETTFTKPTGKHASKTMAPKGAANANSKGKGSS